MDLVDIINSKRNLNQLSKEQLKFVIGEYLNGSVSDFELGYFFSNITGKLTFKDSVSLIEVLGEIYADNLSMSDTIKTMKLTIGENNFNEDIAILSLVNALDKEEQIYTSLDYVKAKCSQNIYSQKLELLEKELGKLNDIDLLALLNFSKIYKSSVLNFVIDIKVGKSSAIKTLEDAIKLGNLLIEYGKASNKKIVCVVTDADKSLLNCFNLLEIDNLLEAKHMENISKIVVTVSVYMVSLATSLSYKDAYQILNEKVEEGQTHTTFVELLHKHGIDLKDKITKEAVCSIKSKKTGFINKIDYNSLLELIGKDSQIVLTKKLQDYILEDEEIVKVYLGDKDVNVNEVLNCFEIDDYLKETEQIVYGVIK